MSNKRKWLLSLFFKCRVKELDVAIAKLRNRLEMYEEIEEKSDHQWRCIKRILSHIYISKKTLQLNKNLLEKIDPRDDGLFS